MKSKGILQNPIALSHWSLVNQINPVFSRLVKSEPVVSYESFLSLLTDSSWGGGGVGYRQWFWQTCTEFGWYQTTNQASRTAPVQARCLPQELSAGVFGSSLPLAFFEKWCKVMHIAVADR